MELLHERSVRLEVLAPHRDGVRLDRPDLPAAVRDLDVQHGHDAQFLVPALVILIEPRRPLTPSRVGDGLLVRLADGLGHDQEPPGEVPVPFEGQRDLVLVVLPPRRGFGNGHRHRVVLAELRAVPRREVVPVRPLPVELRAPRGGHEIAVVVVRQRGYEPRRRQERREEIHGDLRVHLRRRRAIRPTRTRTRRVLCRATPANGTCRLYHKRGRELSSVLPVKSSQPPLSLGVPSAPPRVHTGRGEA